MPAKSLSDTPCACLPAAVGAAFATAVAAAAAFRGATAPNPPVGCVLLDASGAILTSAAHAGAGTAHAEAKALELCRKSGRFGDIASIVVTLEPCNHWGLTPPCTEAILASPAREVWFGVADPNRSVAGGGADRLRAAGLAVRRPGDAQGAAAVVAACDALIAPFAKRVTQGRPWVTVKQALDGSGSMIPPPGRKTFTSDPALTLAHRLRRRADALLTGSGTVLADSPEFTVRRVADFPNRRRRLVVLDRRGRVPAAYRAAAEARGFDVDIGQDVETMLDRLGALGINEVLVEAGPTLTRDLLARDVWDEHVVIRTGREEGGGDSAEFRRRADGSARIFALERDDVPDWP
jgi:diaminohydroxyphosphoribosylaminopyrimidine deaminase/5-amino-6-(5-phosphoribosylamino)uracil reductase